MRQEVLTISDTCYWVYANGISDKEAFDATLEFEVTLIPYEGSDDWVEGVLSELHACLEGDEIPEAGVGCDYCLYRKVADRLEH